MKKGIHNRLIILITCLLAGSKILSAAFILLDNLTFSVSYGFVGSNTVSNFTFAVFRLDTGFALEIIVLAYFIMAGFYFIQNKQKLMAAVSAVGLIAHVGLWIHFL